jgi:hypothetical protein
MDDSRTLNRNGFKMHSNNCHPNFFARNSGIEYYEHFKSLIVRRLAQTASFYYSVYNTRSNYAPCRLYRRRAAKEETGPLPILRLYYWSECVQYYELCFFLLISMTLLPCPPTVAPLRHHPATFRPLLVPPRPCDALVRPFHCTPSKLPYFHPMHSGLL